MRTLLTLVLCLFGFSLSAQPLLRGVYDTNNFALNTNAPASLTNFVFDFNQPITILNATNDVKMMHSTNRQNGAWKWALWKIYTGATNRQLWLNGSWKTLGSTTNYTVLSSNKVVFVSATAEASDETNVTVVISSQ